MMGWACENIHLIQYEHILQGHHTNARTIRILCFHPPLCVVHKFCQTLLAVFRSSFLRPLGWHVLPWALASVGILKMKNLCFVCSGAFHSLKDRLVRWTQRRSAVAPATWMTVPNYVTLKKCPVLCCLGLNSSGECHLFPLERSCQWITSYFWTNMGKLF